MGAEIASKAGEPLVFVILARLLTPEDFGVMAAALMVISFSQVFWDSGMGKALIQRQGDIDKAADAAFWINLVLGVAVAAVLFSLAASISEVFFHDDRVAGVLQVMTLQVFLGAIASVHVALLQKNMQFNRLFWVRFATVSLPGLASIPLAWGGMGYWALVGGTLLGQAAQVVMLWRISEGGDPGSSSTRRRPSILRDLVYGLDSPVCLHGSIFGPIRSLSACIWVYTTLDCIEPVTSSWFSSTALFLHRCCRFCIAIFRLFSMTSSDSVTRCQE